jgi:hypothetical protein
MEANQRQTKLQSERGKNQHAIGRNLKSTFVTRKRGIVFTTEALLLIWSFREALALMYHRLWLNV